MQACRSRIAHPDGMSRGFHRSFAQSSPHGYSNGNANSHEEVDSDDGKGNENGNGRSGDVSGGVLLIVLGAALLHGIWNAIAKAIPARLVSSALIGLVYLVVGAIGCVFLPFPPAAAWPYILVSAAVQTLYLVLLTAAYAKSEFGRIYPLTRGIAVLGVTITAYSVIDGMGVRLSGEPLGYAAWLFLIQGVTIPLVCFLLSRDRVGMLRGMRTHAPMGAIGGILSLVAYTIVVWAQTLAPLAVVSALRETGVLAAGVIGYLVFRERFSPWRLTATVVAVSGIVAIRLGG
jgi:drug/metabolite transporter (DMT)-like permease